MKFPRSAFFLTSFLSVIVAFPALAVNISSSTHPALVAHDFTGDVAFAPYQREGGVASGARFEIENGALKITNAHAGSFGIDTKTPSFDVEKFGHLFFDYLIPPTAEKSLEVKVNIFVRVKGNYHGVHFTGPKEVRPGSVFLGELSDVKTDGKWHRAHLPLRDWLRRLYPREKQLPIEEIIIGNWDNSNYLMAGIGGNGVGATWKMDNFTIAGVGPSEAKFEIKADAKTPLVQPAEYSWSLDDGAATPLKTPEITISADEGFRLLRVFDKTKNPVGAYGFFVAGSTPKVGEAALVNGVLQVPINSSAGLNVANVKLAVGERAFETDSPYLRWDGAAGVLTLDAAGAGLRWKDGEQIPLALSGAQDRLGRPVPDWKNSVKVEYAAQKSLPVPPQLVELKAIGAGTFEESLDEWATREGQGAAIVERDSSTIASGKYSVRLTSSGNAATMAAWIRRTPFDAVKYPVIEFDYKISDDVRVDFHVQVGGQTYSIGFTDRTPQYTRIGQIADVKADDKWHHARIDLLAWLRKARPTASTHNIEWLAIGDAGYLGNGRDAQLWIDNFQMMPVVQGTPFQSGVALSDITGVQALSWVLDDNPATVPPMKPTENSDTLKVQGAGPRWLHVRAQNGAGQWSYTAHVPLALDATPPVVGAPNPAPNSKSGRPQLTIDIKDDTGLDTADLALTFQDRAYALKSEFLDYNDATGLLSLDLSKMAQRGQLAPLADGAKLSWKLAVVRDAAGRSTPETSGAWTYDLAADKTLPTLTIDATSRTPVFHHDFENGLGPINVSNAKTEIVERPDLMGGSPNKALRLTPEAVGRPLVLRLTTRATNVNTQNLFGFHYKISPNAKVALRLRTGREVSHLKMIGDAPTEIGEIAGIVADDTWRWAQFDLKTIADKIRGNNIAAIELVDPTGTTPVDAAIEIDNVLLQPGASGPTKLMWKGSDVSGIEKYRVAWDQNPATAPTEETTEASRSFEAKSGLWWAHVQTLDKAGNWSAVTHWPVMVP